MTFLAALRDTTRPDAPDALRIGDVTLSWSQVRDAASTFAAGVDRTGPVAVCAVPTMETVVAVTGCLLAGVPVVPIAPDSGPAELAHLVTDSGATSWAGPLRDGIELPVQSIDLHPSDPAPLPEAIDEATPATILYTSGTTGSPKGVLMSHHALRTGIEGLAEAWGWTDADTVAHGLPLFHTHGLVLGVLGSLHIGSRAVHTGKPTPELYAAAEATMYFGVPTVWTRVARDPESARRLASARLLVSGSAPLPVPVFERLRELTGQSPIERYGMTETLLTLSTRADGERRPGWVGLPVGEAETRIRGEDGSFAPHDGETVGRLEVRGPMLFDGYLNLPEVTAEVFTEDGWFVTGDLAVVDADGFHRIVGRESVDLIKSGGYRIGAGEIETSLLSRPEVHEVAVVGLPDEDLGQRIVAFVVTAEASDDLAASLVDHVATDLSWHKRPREVRFVESLPRNHMGKIQKKQLLEPAP
ncbi:acyl-CoA synthetase [Aeromicrobium sp. Leaf350]|uniref:acyl-CoA synthetase n=1 Tax=Aeromicrobium sp. Leaf350 TaxID=2876565 RepID=UPI001E627FFA|nr:acyl-CoA synthetase [Aeromicrobium sp. Leaf350]